MTTPTNSLFSRLAAGGWLLFLILALAVQAGAEVKPGDAIGAESASKVKDLVSPGAYYALQHGMRMNVVATDRIDWPPPYKDATEKYSGQVRLTPDHRSLAGYVAGQPFPLIDANDPEVAQKIMWNNVFRPLISDDGDLRFFDCNSQYAAKGAKENPIDYIQVGHYAGYSLVGRTEVEPMPTDPDFKQTNRLSMFALYPVLAPASARGAGLLRYRYADPNRGDDAWTVSGTSRRVRRLNEAILSSATGAQTFDPDHYAGFNAKTEEYDYKFLGEKDMLASVHAVHSPLTACSSDGGATACPENWEMRHMYIVEARPDRKRISGALDSRSVVFMDSELWWAPFVDTYDQKGQLWRGHLSWTTYRDRPVPDAKVAVYPFKRAFIVGGSSIDTQSGLTTMCYLPGRNTPERECWYINMGAVDKGFFTVQAMVKAAH